MDPPLEPPKTPPNKFPKPPTPREKTPPPSVSCDINTSDAQGPFGWERRIKSPDFEVHPLKGGDFQERPTLEEWADKQEFNKLPSGMSVLSGRPDPSDLKSGAKLPPFIEKIDHLLKEGDEDPKQVHPHGYLHLLLTRYRLSSEKPTTSELKPKPGSITLETVEGQQKQVDQQQPKSSSEEHPFSEPNSGLGAIPKSAEGLQKKADQKDPKPPSGKSNTSNVELGAMLPPPLRAPQGLQKKTKQQTPKSSYEKSNRSKQEIGAMPQRLLKGAARLQEMADMANPQQAEEDRAKVFMDRLSYVQAASRRLQGQLEIHSDETWPLPVLPNDRNPFVIQTNAMKIRAALENCKDFAVTMDRESSKFEFLDVVAKCGEKRVTVQAGQPSEIRLTSFEDDKKASEAEQSNASARMMDQGRQEELKELEDEGMSAASKDENLVSASQGGSSVDTSERERREEWEELEKNPHFGGIGPYERAEYNSSPSLDLAERSDALGATPEWVYREDATPNSHYDFDGNSIPYNTPTASNDDREMRTPSHRIETDSIASEHISAALAPPSRELGALSVHDSGVGGTQSMIDEAVAVLNAQCKGESRETSPGAGETTSDRSRTQDKGKGKDTSSSVGGNSPQVSQTRQKGKGKDTISGFHGTNMDEGEKRHGKMTGLGEKLDVAASLHNHSVTYLDETQPKVKERNPPVPQPENMPNTLTEAICNYIPLEAKSILTLTLERVDPPVPSPTDQRCILLKHFEFGLDGVEGLCQGTARIPETLEATAEREKRVGKLGTFKQGDGGFYRSLKSAQQKDQQYGKGYWYFFGIKFKQTGRERKLKRGGKWLLFGAPIEAVYHLDIKRSQENVAVLLGGGVDKSGTAIKPFEANFKRTHTLFSRGGLAPMDIWPGGEDWNDGVFKDIRTAMAHNGLRVGFLYADTQTFTPTPTSFPAAGKSQAEKKRKQSGAEMTEDETKAMEKSMKPKKLSDEDIGTILAMRVINDKAKQDAAARSQ
ncbi:MAG: hypothetical protein ASARMPREDX12_000844 [Alectoria sarmentosa]|nr:MAG: hypothetical protein ASARMPREDX12_000844 [Alectoria sarmentosa]